MLLDSRHCPQLPMAEEFSLHSIISAGSTLDQDRHCCGIPGDLKKFTKVHIFHGPGINFRMNRHTLGSQKEHGFDCRKDDSAANGMILKPGLNGKTARNTLVAHQRGNAFQRLMVFSSISTGMFLPLTAQCLVKPVQEISPPSALVIT